MCFCYLFFIMKLLELIPKKGKETGMESNRRTGG